ncbi:MAG: DegT/DnrJ/EryC1/StrS family aminotransferase [Chloroflexota bacterium]|nr:DegT/DnrJ/EryC1/StrS family aminotransferase [Chloroflexota bacterium]
MSLSRPDITELEVKYVTEVLTTPHLSLGPRLAAFEERVAGYVGRKFGVAVNSGTSGLHLILLALGIGEGDEVITTPFSFIASASCILYPRARPVFVDIDPETWNIDAARVEKAIGPRTRAILAVDVFGYPAAWGPLTAIARKHGLKLIEDSCEALGAEYREEKAGSFGDMAVFSFYPNKQITTGEGGVIVTDQPELAQVCRSLRNQGRDEGDEWLNHRKLGYNYRMSDILCALGLAQMERLTEVLARREQVAQWYNQRLGGEEKLSIPFASPEVKRSWFVYTVLLGEAYSQQDRDRIIGALNSQGIECRNYFPPIHLQPFYRESFGYQEGDFPVAESVGSRTIALPFHNRLTEGEVAIVVERLRQLL